MFDVFPSPSKQAHYLQVPPTVACPTWTARAVVASRPAAMNSKPASESRSAAISNSSSNSKTRPAVAAVVRYWSGAAAAVAVADYLHSIRPRPLQLPGVHSPRRWLSRRRQRPSPSNICSSKHKPTCRRARSCGPTFTTTARRLSGTSGTSGPCPVSSATFA